MTTDTPEQMSIVVDQISLAAALRSVLALRHVLTPGAFTAVTEGGSTLEQLVTAEVETLKSGVRVYKLRGTEKLEQLLGMFVSRDQGSNAVRIGDERAKNNPESLPEIGLELAGQ